MKCIYTSMAFAVCVALGSAVHADEKGNAANETTGGESKHVLFKNKEVQKEIYYKVVGNMRDPFFAPGKQVVRDNFNFTKKQVIKALRSHLGVVGRGPKPLCMVKVERGKRSKMMFAGGSFNLDMGSSIVKVKILEIKATSDEGVVFLVGKKTYTVHK